MKLASKLDPIHEVAAAYRRSDSSPLEVTRTLLARIDEVDPILNAFVSVWASDALRAAERAERELRGGVDRGVLHGIPVALKDLIDTQDHPTTYGTRVVPAGRPLRDADVVRRLKASGAVILGKTNLLEFAYGNVHRDFGQTNNPWDSDRTAGGSSGGSAAAVAAGLCFAAIGTDTGGSVRIPAAYCGVAGFKPTFDRLSLEGVFPLSWSLDHLGPITCDAVDLQQVWGALTGSVATFALPDRPLRLGNLTRYVDAPDVADEVGRVIVQLLGRLVGEGALVEDVDVPLLAECDEHFVALLLPEASLIHEHLHREQPDGYAPATREQIEAGFEVPAVAYLRAQRYREALTSEIDALLNRYDALLVPTAPWVAPAEDPAIGTEAGDIEARRTAPFNMTGHPTISVNAGFASGLPIGLQVVTRRHHDEQAIALARWVETFAGAGDRDRRPPG